MPLLPLVPVFILCFRWAVIESPMGLYRKKQTVRNIAKQGHDIKYYEIKGGMTPSFVFIHMLKHCRRTSCNCRTGVCSQTSMQRREKSYLLPKLILNNTNLQKYLAYLPIMLVIFFCNLIRSKIALFEFYRLRHTEILSMVPVKQLVLYKTTMQTYSANYKEIKWAERHRYRNVWNFFMTLSPRQAERNSDSFRPCLHGVGDPGLVG